MAEGVFGVWAEPHLIDQLNTEQLVDHLTDAERGQQLRIEAGPDHRCRIQCLLGRRSESVDARFDKAGAVLLGCHLHASMRAHVYVSDTPWAMVSGEDGVASFDAVPEGPVRIKVWQADQMLDLPPQQMTLTPAPASATMQLQVVPRRRRV